MKKYLIHTILFAIFLACTSTSFAQETEAKPFRYYVDYVQGPYLFLDNIAYEAVFVHGCRLGFKIKEQFDFSIEYVAGHQSDNMDDPGMTHYANGQFAYHFVPDGAAFNPYMFAGGGFFEFKEFTVDEYGFAYHIGLGTNLRITNRINGLIEARYLNTGLLDVDGQNQVAVTWGVRVAF